jgi:hypothetical protein
MQALRAGGASVRAKRIAVAIAGGESPLRLGWRRQLPYDGVEMCAGKFLDHCTLAKPGGI